MSAGVDVQTVLEEIADPQVLAMAPTTSLHLRSSSHAGLQDTATLDHKDVTTVSRLRCLPLLVTNHLGP